MKTRIGRPIWLLAIGLLSAGGAWTVRQTILNHRRPSIAPPVVTNMTALEAQLGKLLAAVKAAPRDLDAHWKLVGFYNRYGLNDQAREELKRIYALDPTSPRAPLATARDLMERQQYADAETIYRAVKLRWPKEVGSWEGLASADYHQGRYYEAMEAGKVAVKLRPSDPNSNLILASSALEYVMQFPNPAAYENEIHVSRRIFLRLTQIWPDNGEIYFRLARACGAGHDIRNELENLRHAARLLPERQDITEALARACLDTGDVAAAKQVLASGLIAHPDDALMHGLMGRLWDIIGGPDANQKAVEEYHNAAGLAPNSAAYKSHLGVAYLRIQNLTGARDAFLAFIALQPDKPFGYQQLAVIYNRLGDAQRARIATRMATAMVANEQQLKQIQQLSTDHPGNIALHLALADRYRDLHLFGPSRDQYLNVIRQDRRNRRAKDGLIRLGKEIVHTRNNSTRPVPVTPPNKGTAHKEADPHHG